MWPFKKKVKKAPLFEVGESVLYFGELISYQTKINARRWDNQEKVWKYAIKNPVIGRIDDIIDETKLIKDGEQHGQV